MRGQMVPRNRTIILSVFGLFLLGAWLLFGWRGDPLVEPEPGITAEIFGGDASRAVFVNAGTVTVQRLTSGVDSRYQKNLDNYKQGPALPLTGVALTELRSLFQQSSSFDWYGAKSCLPEFAVLITFHSEPHPVKLALCFKCRQFAIWHGEKEVNAEEDFDPIASKLAALLKPLFPGDAEIQSLP